MLVTNTHDFVLVGEDTNGQPAKLETFRLADSAEAFARGLETPQAFAPEDGRRLGGISELFPGASRGPDRTEGTWRGCSPRMPATPYIGSKL